MAEVMKFADFKEEGSEAAVKVMEAFGYYRISPFSPPSSPLSNKSGEGMRRGAWSSSSSPSPELTVGEGGRWWKGEMWFSPHFTFAPHPSPLTILHPVPVASISILIFPPVTVLFST